MAAAVEVLTMAGFILGMVWLAVFICTLGDLHSGYSRDDCAEKQATGRRTGWKALLAPLGCALVVLLAPPMVLAVKLWTALGGSVPPARSSLPDSPDAASGDE